MAMTAEESELSRKLLNAQKVLIDMAEMVMEDGRAIRKIQERIDKLEAVVEGMATGKKAGTTPNDP